MALGPTVKPIPDVFIGPQAAAGAPAETGVNTFRYSDALTLWDYVTVGVETGDGSTPESLYWAWAAKAADLSGGNGAFLDSSSTNYTIIQENAVEAKQLTPTKEVGADGWVAEVNNALTSLGSGLSDYSLAAAGALTFRDINLSPLPEQAAYPAPGATGVLGVQEATVYVTDTNTTPGTETFLLVTVAEGPDTLSGGPSFSAVADYSSNTSGFAAFGLSATASDSKIASTINPTQVVFNNAGAGSISITMPLANETGKFYFGQVTELITAEANTLYRVQTTLGSSNANPAVNPTVLVGFNARGNAGYGYYEVNQGSPLGPTSTATKTVSGYLASLMAGTPQVYLRVYDADSNFGGTTTFSGIKVASVPMADVLAAATEVSNTTSFDRAQWPDLVAGGIQFAGYAKPTFTSTPATGTAATMTQSGSTNTHVTPPTAANQQGFASIQGNGKIASTVGKLVVVAATLATSSADSAKIPMTWLNVEEINGLGQPNLVIERNTAATSGPSLTPRDYYVVYEATAASANFNFRIWADTSQVNGNIILSGVKVLELDVPALP